MSTTTLRPAATAIIAHGGHVYPNGRFQLDAKIQGKPKTINVDAILYNMEQGINILWSNKHCIEKNLEKSELEQIEKWILENISVPVFPEGKGEFRTQMLLLNSGFICNHGELEESDFQKAEAIAKAITEARSFKDGKIIPLPGDIVEGAYYNGKFPFNHGLVDTPYAWQSHDKLSICAQPYIPFSCLSDEKRNGYALSTSGGPFFSISAEDMELIGQDENIFCTWGHEGPCANGDIKFKAPVNRWRIKEGTDY